MSHVTNVILSFSIMENDDDRLAEVNAYLAGAEQEGRFVNPDRVVISSWLGGTKALERPTFVAAFNYLDIEGLVRHLPTFTWREPDEVQLFVCRQEENRYTDLLQKNGKVADMQDRMMQFFSYAHLPEPLQAVSKPWCDLAQRVVETLPANAERTVALRKLLEGKDAAVRAMIWKAET